MSTLLELRGVEKRYNNGTLALLDSLDTAGSPWNDNLHTREVENA